MEKNTALIDQLVSIVQHVLETKVEGALEHLVHIKMDDVVLNLVMCVCVCVCMRVCVCMCVCVCLLYPCFSLSLSLSLSHSSSLL